MSASLPTYILIGRVTWRNRTCAEQSDPSNRA